MPNRSHLADAPKAALVYPGSIGSFGLLIARTRRLAASAILLIAVFPANIYMAIAHVPFKGLLGNRWLQWLRLPSNSLDLVGLAVYPQRRRSQPQIGELASSAFSC